MRVAPSWPPLRSLSEPLLASIVSPPRRSARPWRYTAFRRASFEAGRQILALNELLPSRPAPASAALRSRCGTSTPTLAPSSHGLVPPSETQFTGCAPVLPLSLRALRGLFVFAYLLSSLCGLRVSNTWQRVFPGSSCREERISQPFTWGWRLQGAVGKYSRGTSSRIRDARAPGGKVVASGFRVRGNIPKCASLGGGG